MFISKIKLKNWRNFREAEAFSIGEVSYILGPNASGKSNLLDAIRFLRDVAKTRGGGLQAAIEKRGGIKKLRCLHARGDTEVRLEIEVSSNDGTPAWSYTVGFNLPARGTKEPIITEEQVQRFTDDRWSIVVNRPGKADEADPVLRRETNLEQISANADFRELATFLGNVTYVHLVPQLLKFGEAMSGRILDDDPFGQGFLLRVSGTTARTRDARLKRITRALKSIVPHMDDLNFVKDDVTGHPHLEIRFRHHRPRGALQREDQFSDGTLRLISLVWLLQEGGDAPLLLEEPELSLNEEIVSQLPLVIDKIRREGRVRRQVFITTHSNSLLSNEGIDAGGLIIIEPSQEGSSIRKTTESENIALDQGFTPAEVVLPAARKISTSGQFALKL